MTGLSTPSVSTSSSPHSSPTHSRREDDEDRVPPVTYNSFYVNTDNRDRIDGAKELNPYDTTSRILSTVTLVCFVASIALLILGFLSKVHPLSCLYPVGGAVAILILYQILDCRRKCIADNHGFDIIHHDNLKFPKPPKKEKKESE